MELLYVSTQTQRILKYFKTTTTNTTIANITATLRSFRAHVLPLTLSFSVLYDTFIILRVTALSNLIAPLASVAKSSAPWVIGTSKNGSNRKNISTTGRIVKAVACMNSYNNRNNNANIQRIAQQPDCSFFPRLNRFGLRIRSNSSISFSRIFGTVSNWNKQKQQH